MRKFKKYILGGIAATLLFYIPTLNKLKKVDKEMDENEDKIKGNFNANSSLNLVHLDKAILNDTRTFYSSSLFGKQVLFHKITDHADFAFQNYVFAGNIVNVYKDANNIINFDVQLFMSNYDLCLDEIKNITRKEISKDLILRGFLRSELRLA